MTTIGIDNMVGAWLRQEDSNVYKNTTHRVQKVWVSFGLW